MVTPNNLRLPEDLMVFPWKCNGISLSVLLCIEGGVSGVRIPQYRTWQRENTAIPHQNLPKYRNHSYKWEKVDIVNTKNPPFK